MKTHISKLSAVLALLAIASAAHAATITWTNTNPGYWSDTNNWSPNQVPAGSDTAIIIGSVVSVTYPVTNTGTINLTNATVIEYSGLTGLGGFFNQAGGVVNLQGASTIASSPGSLGDTGYFINRGIVTEGGGAGSAINVTYFDNSQGTISNLSGTLVLGVFQTNLAGAYYAGAGATIQFAGAVNATPLVPGTPFALSGNGQFQLTSGYLRLATDWNPKLTLIGTMLDLGPGFQGGAITNLALDGILLTNTLPVTGTFAATNSPVYGNFTVASGGVFTESNAFTHGSVTVANGGVLTANESSAFALTVAANGVLNLAGPFSISSGLSPPLTNSGAINISMTNGTVVIAKGIANQAGGQITLSGNGDSIQGAAGTEYFVNQGRVTQNCDPDTTNTINFANLDNSQGSVTNLSGTLVLQTFQTNLAGTFSAVAGATNILSGGTASTPLVPGTPLVVAGAGQNLFASGYLLLSTTAVPGLLLQGGMLELGAGFQGGAITNLALGSMTLTNTLPVTGMFTAANNNQLYGSFTVANGGVFNDGAVTHGAVTVASGGSISMTRATISAGGSLTLANGVVVNIFAGGPSLYGPLTNAGTINLSNPPTSYFSGILVLNDGTANFQGGPVNLATGQINFQTDRTLIANGYGGGHEYLINQGHIIRAGDTGLSLLEIPLSTNSGAITVQSGILNMVPMTLLPAGSLHVGLNSATNYGTFTLGTNTVLNGAFNATLNNGYVPTNGTSFIVISYPSASGTFNSMDLPAAVNWQSNYGSTNFSLMVGSAKPQFGTFNLSGTNLIFNGIGGSPGNNYIVLVSTNLTLPLANWTAVTTNVFDGTGQFHYTNNISPTKPRQFFTFKLP